MGVKTGFICPQCCGFFPSISHACSNHPDRFSNFMCYACGRPFCNLDKLEVKQNSGNYIFKVWAGCPDQKKCEHSEKLKAKFTIYKDEFKDYNKKYKGEKCPSCGKKYKMKKMYPKLKLSERYICEECKQIIAFTSSIKELNVLDYPELLESAYKPPRTSEKPKPKQQFCPKCNSRIKGSMEFCSECGTKLNGV